MSDNNPKSLGAEDFICFAVLLVISCGIGIYFACKNRRRETMDSYFFGEKKMNPITVGMSMMVTYLSAVGLVSSPAESYIVGNVEAWDYIVRCIGMMLAIIYFIPAFRRAGVKTKFEFLEKRFNRPLRMIAAFMGILASQFYTGLVVYISSATVSALTPLSLNLSIVLSSVICTFYTTLGGMNAVVWTDALQFIFMLVGMFAISIQGMIAIGGFGNLMDATDRGERNTFFKFENGVIARVSPLATILGSFGGSIHSGSFSQQLIQRFLSCKTTNQARFAMLLNIVFTTLTGLILVGVGLIMYAFFEGCDPVASGQIASIDQGVPLMTLALFADLPGMAGFFIAAIFGASLSTVSSNINSFSIVIIEDALAPCWKKLQKSETMKVIVGKITVFALGLVSMSIAFAAANARSNVIQLLFSFTGVINGPLAGIYLLGFFYPWADWMGAMIGLVLSFGFGIFLFIGNEFFKITYPQYVPPVYVDACPIGNFTTEFWTQTDINTTTSSSFATSTESNRSALQDLYNLNFRLFFLIGMMTAFLIGAVVSLISGPNKPSQCDPKLFIPIIDNSCFPEGVRKFFRFGVPELEYDEDYIDEEKYVQEDKL